MKLLTQILILAFLASCNNYSHEAVLTSNTDSAKLISEDSVFSLSVTKNISDTSIINTTGKTIDILFNGVDNYLGGQRNPKMNFATECMVCEPVQVYEHGFLFGKRLSVTKDSIVIYTNDRNLPDTAGIVKMKSYYGERKTRQYQFSQGNLTFKYQGQSCIDADFASVNLSYVKGSIKVSKFINASFFEYDLNNNGIKEQYLLGTRNCSQEVVLLRINDAN
jgi:hypothetical protein